jgi:ABC-type transport system substrate-binding protein
MKINRIWRWGLLVSIFSFFGCAGPNSLYSINMHYDAEQATIPVYLKADDKTSNTIISVAEFTDSRQIDDRLVVGRVEEKDGMKILVLPKYTKATKAISSGIKEYLKKAGYKVADKIEQWDLKEETIPKGVAKILIGGNIEELEISCRRGFLTNSYKANMKLTIYFADLVKGKIFYKSKVESSSSQEHVLFSEARLGEQANIVLDDAIENFFEERVVAQKIKEAISR